MSTAFQESEQVMKNIKIALLSLIAISITLNPLYSFINHLPISTIDRLGCITYPGSYLIGSTLLVYVIGHTKKVTLKESLFLSTLSAVSALFGIYCTFPRISTEPHSIMAGAIVASLLSNSLFLSFIPTSFISNFSKNDSFKTAAKKITSNTFISLLAFFGGFCGMYSTHKLLLSVFK